MLFEGCLWSDEISLLFFSMEPLFLTLKKALSDAIYKGFILSLGSTDLLASPRDRKLPELSLI